MGCGRAHPHIETGWNHHFILWSTFCILCDEQHAYVYGKQADNIERANGSVTVSMMHLLLIQWAQVAVDVHAESTYGVKFSCERGHITKDSSQSWRNRTFQIYWCSTTVMAVLFTRARVTSALPWPWRVVHACCRRQHHSGKHAVWKQTTHKAYKLNVRKAINAHEEKA